MLFELARKLSSRLEAMAGKQQVVRLDHACVAYSGDAIRRICSEEVDDFLDEPDFASRWYAYTTTLRTRFWSESLVDPKQGWYFAFYS